MKKYVKPETIVKDVVLTSMIASSANITSGGSTSENNVMEADAKTRDVWKDGFWD